MESRIITINKLRSAETAVAKDPKYGKEQDLIERIIKMHPLNDDLYWIAMKVSVIDVTNSTQLTNYKSKLSLFDISKIILNLKIDNRIKDGDEKLVSDIARECKVFEGNGVNLFSFASKYCCYHNIFAYGRDDYSIFDNVVSEHLHEFSTKKLPLKKTQPEEWRKSMDYKSYNQYIEDLLDEMEISGKGRRRMFDHFVWNKYRKSNKNN